MMTAAGSGYPGGTEMRWHTMSDPGKNTIAAQAAAADDTNDGQSSLDDRMNDFQPVKLGHIDPPPDRFTWQPGDITWDDDSDHPEK